MKAAWIGGVHRWGGEFSDLLRGAALDADVGPAPCPGAVPTIVTGAQLASVALARLDQLAGNDKVGRSG